MISFKSAFVPETKFSYILIDFLKDNELFCCSHELTPYLQRKCHLVLETKSR